MAEVGYLVLDDQRDVGGHAQADLSGQRRGFRERVQVLARERQRDRLLHLDGHRLVLLVDGRRLGELDVGRSGVAGGGKADTFLGARDDDGFPELGQVAADAGELLRRHAHDASVVGLRDPQMFLIEVHQLHLIVRHLLLVLRLEHERDSVGIVLRFDRHCVSVIGALEDFRHVRQVHSHRQVAVAAVFIEAVGAQVQRDEGDMRVVHGLKLMGEEKAPKVRTIATTTSSKLLT